MRKPWTHEEDQFVKALYGKVETSEIAKALGRTLAAVYARGQQLRSTRKRADFGPKFEAFLRSRNAEGWPDSEIARAWKCDRHAVGRRRRELGLPCNALSKRRRDAVRRKTREQLARAGLSSLAELRAKAYRDFAKRSGWPDDLPPRCVQILNVLWERGPMTRRELADAIGMPWRGVRQSLKSNTPEGSYLGHLIARGMVFSFGRIVKGRGRGHSVCLYCLSLSIHREVPHEQAKQWTRTPTASELRGAGMAENHAGRGGAGHHRAGHEGDGRRAGQKGKGRRRQGAGVSDGQDPRR